jgi:hypothetical protein
VVSTVVAAVADKPNLLVKARDISQLLTRINSYCALHKARFLCHTDKSHDSTVVQKNAVMHLDKLITTSLKVSSEISPAEPLWKRVPMQNAEGKNLSDFMMIIPQLKHQSVEKIKAIVNEIEQVLRFYEKQVVFADLNLNLNVLWVSVQPVAGICLEVAAAIHHRVPEAKLVASKIS